MLKNKDIEMYEIKKICTQSINVRIQIRLNQIVWNDGIEINFKTETNFLDI